jgi:hypothetical protein
MIFARHRFAQLGAAFVATVILAASGKAAWAQAARTIPRSTPRPVVLRKDPIACLRHGRAKRRPPSPGQDRRVPGMLSLHGGATGWIRSKKRY